MGSTIVTACKICGITEQLYYHWRSRVSDGKGSALQKELVTGVDVALAEAKGMAEAGIMAAGRKNWCAFAWWLERRYPGEYGRKTGEEVEDGPGVVINVINASGNDQPQPAAKSGVPGGGKSSVS
jgi:hypothetical protein